MIATDSTGWGAEMDENDPGTGRGRVWRHRSAAQPAPQPAPHPAPYVRAEFGADGPSLRPVVDPPASLVSAMVPVVRAGMPEVAALIPDGPAAVLGRIGVPVGPPVRSHLPPAPAPAVDQALADEVLAALRTALNGLIVDGPPQLAEHVPRVVLPGTIAVVTFSGQSAARTDSSMLEQVAPHVPGVVLGLVAGLAAHPDLQPALESASEVDRGRTHLALAVVTALAVLRTTSVPLVGSRAAVVVGAALDAVTRVLPDAPLSASHLGALAEQQRAAYEMPRFLDGTIPVAGHRFALAESALSDVMGEPTNGLVQAVPGGIVVRTGMSDGVPPLWLRVLPEPPDEVDLKGWHEVVELSYTAVDGSASVLGAGAVFQRQTPPWPGPIRARVHARGRDEHADGTGGKERYEIVLWPAPAAPEVVYRAVDRLGHRLRGEPEPAAVARPEAAYCWVDDTSVGYGSTVTVVTGASVEEVLVAFGADPAEPTSMRECVEQLGIEPWVAVLPVDGAVVAVEYNGWQGSHAVVLQSASARGRAASMYQNGGNAVTGLSFARDGVMLDSWEPLFPHTSTDPDVQDVLAGVDLDDYTDLFEKGLVAVELFTGTGIRREHVARIEETDVAYWIQVR